MTTYTYVQGNVYTDVRKLPAVRISLPQLLTLEGLLEGQRAIPAYSIVLGICEDNLPLVVELTETASGSFLISGDSGFANTTLLKSILSSALYLNTDYEVNAHLISPEADSLTHFHRHKNFKISYQPGRPEVEVALEEMVNLVKARQVSGRKEPYHLLFIDSLDLLWDALSEQGKFWFSWLISHGAGYGLHTIVSLETAHLSPALYPIVDRFPSRILGRIQADSQARQLIGGQHEDLSVLIPEAEFVACTEGQKYRLRLLPSKYDC